MIDTSSMPLQTFCELAERPRRRNASGKSQGPADALKVVYWYHVLRELDPLATPYAIGKLIEPAGYSREGEPGSRTHAHRNKWSKYSVGYSTPHPTLIEAAELRCIGSRAAISHPIWGLLDRNFKTTAELMRNASRFSRDAQIAIGQLSTLKSPESPLAKLFAFNVYLMEPLDCLGILIFLLHKARIEGNSFVQVEVVHAVYKALVLHGHELKARGVARPLFELIRDDHLHSVLDGGFLLSFRASDYLKVLDLFERFVDLLDEGSMAFEVRFRRRRAVFMGLGCDLGFIALPVPIVQDSSSADEISHEKSAFHQRVLAHFLKELTAGRRNEILEERVAIEKVPYCKDLSEFILSEQ